MQIEAFVLYHRELPEPRILPLKPGLNIISGWRNTGKTSLIDLVEYCFGRSELTVSQGKIRRTVSWYGMVLRVQKRYVFVGRPAPKEGKASTRDAMFTSLSSPQPPGRQDLTVNTDVDGLREALSGFAGFADARFEPPEGAARRPLSLHIAHALPLCLQDEEDIDSRSRLFHRGDDRDVMQALRDTFPYLVGAADASTPALRAQLNVRRVEARQIRRDLDRMLDAGADADEHGLSLLVSAAKVGLAAPPSLGEGAPTHPDVLAALRSVVAQDAEAAPSVTPTGEVERLLEDRRGVYEQLREADRDAALLRDFGDDRDAFAMETNEQRARLATIRLLSSDGHTDTCPVCAQTLENPDEHAEKLLAHMRALDAELEGMAIMEPDRKSVV